MGSKIEYVALQPISTEHLVELIEHRLVGRSPVGTWGPMTSNLEHIERLALKHDSMTVLCDSLIQHLLSACFTSIANLLYRGNLGDDDLIRTTLQAVGSQKFRKPGEVMSPDSIRGMVAHVRSVIEPIDGIAPDNDLRKRVVIEFARAAPPRLMTEAIFSSAGPVAELMCLSNPQAYQILQCRIDRDRAMELLVSQAAVPIYSSLDVEPDVTANN